MNWLKKKYNVYFVCVANITRSPYFEVLLQRYLRTENKDIPHQVCVFSAGTHAHKGRQADPAIKLIAAQQGMSLARHSSRSFGHADAQKADLVLTMDDLQKQDVLLEHPELGGRVYAVREYAANNQGQPSLNISDPTGREPDLYRQFCHLANTESARIGKAVIEGLCSV